MTSLALRLELHQETRRRRQSPPEMRVFSVHCSRCRTLIEDPSREVFERRLPALCPRCKEIHDLARGVMEELKRRQEG